MAGQSEEASLSIIVRARDEASAVLQNIGGQFGHLGVGAVAMGAIGVAAIAGIGAMSLKMAADFQTSTDALVTGAGESAKSLELVRQGILKLAPEVGVGPKQLSDGLYLIESAGYHGAQGLDVLRVAAIAAKVGNADMATVSDALTSALNAYAIPASNAAHVTDILIQTVAMGKMHMSDLAGNIGKLLPIASQAGISLGEMGSAIATMTMQGTNAAQATTSLRFLISNLEAPTHQAAGALKSVGLSATEVFNALHDPSKGLHGALQEIVDHINTKFKPGSAEAVAAFKEIVGGTRGLTAGLELTGTHMATFKDNISQMNAASSGAGKTMEGWHFIQGAFNLSLERFKAGLQVAAIELGDHLLPAATWFMNVLIAVTPTLFNVISGIFSFVGGVLSLANRLGILIPILAGVASYFVIIQGISLVAMLVGLIGPIVGAVGAFISLAASEGLVATMTLITISPFVLIAIAIAAVIAIGVLLITHWTQVSAIAREVGTVVMDALGHAFDFVKNLLIAAVTFYIGIWATIISIFTNGVNSIVSWVTQEIPKIPYQIGYALGVAIGTLITWGADAYRWVTTAIPAFISAFVGFVEALPGRVWAIFLQVSQKIADFENAAIAWVARAIPALVEGIVTFLAALPGRIWGVLTSAAQQFLNIAPTMAGNGASAAGSVVTAIWNALTGLPGRVVSIGHDIVSGIWHGIQNMAGWLAGQVASFASGIVDGIKKSMHIGSPSLVMALEVGEPLVHGIVQGIGNQAWRIADAVKSAMPTGASVASSTVGNDVGMTYSQQAAAYKAAYPTGNSAPSGSGRDVVIPLILNGREIARAVLAEAELLRRLRGGNLAGGAG